MEVVDRIYPDWEKREALIKGYEGQIRYCDKRIAKAERDKAKHRRVKKDPDKVIAQMEFNKRQWQERIDRCKSGAPLDFLGKSLNWKGARRGEPNNGRTNPSDK